jgi:hypothetical protein
MNSETKKRIKGFLETLKDFEIHGGEPADYKENLVNLRESIKKAVFEGQDSKFSEILLNSLKEINDNIGIVDILRMQSITDHNPDDLIRQINAIQTLASLLIKQDMILLLEVMVNNSL